MKRHKTISIICTLLVLLWVYAAGSKLADYDAFTIQLARQPLPDWSIGIIAWALPVFEVLLAIGLCFSRTQQLGLLLSFLLLICFTLYVGLALSGILGEIPCSCGGIIQKLHWSGHLVLNIIFTALAVIGWLLIRRDQNQLSINGNLMPTS